MEAYARVLRAPRLASFAIASLLARAPIGMAAIGLVLYLQHVKGSFAAAGAVAAAFAVGLGLTAPFLSRLVDDRGRGVLVPMALVSSLALAALVVLGDGGAASAWLVAASGVSGLAAPPIGGVVRHRLAEMVDPADVPTVFAFDSILIEFIFIGGPLLTGLLAATTEPATALVVAAAAGLLGTVWLVFLLPPHAHDPAARAERTLLGALVSPTVRFIVLTGIPLGATFGALDVALPAFGVGHGSAALGGPFGAALAVGSLLGGVAYGLRPRALGEPRDAFVRISVLQLVLTLPLLVGPPVPAMLVLAAVAGTCVAPLVSVRSEIVRDALPPRSGTEAFTWSSMTIAIGASLGSAVAGPVVEAGGWRLGVLTACAAPLSGAVAAIRRRHLL